ncbi:MAG: tetratricopeptide repeat protein, partial [Acidobacteria bacterium]|nr:tetratricopeptide repeat protein [Acidobacteriota bacterium]
MATPADQSGAVYRFGVFEVNVRAGELLKQGVHIKLQDQPFGILVMLLERSGEVVTRDELRHRLWPQDVFVDFDQGLNKAINKLREALGDSADNPRFIQTLPKRGYRFIAPVHQPQAAGEQSTASGLLRPDAASPPAQRKRWLWGTLAAVSMVALWTQVAHRVFPQPPETQPGRILLAVLPFDNLSGNPEQDYVSDGMTEEIITQLGRLRPERLGVISRTSVMRYKQSKLAPAEIGQELGVEYLLSGSVRREGPRVRVAVQLVRASDQTQAWVETYDRDAQGVITVQQDVAQGIARSLALELLPAQRAALARSPTTSTAAHDAYLKGRFYWSERTESSLRKSLEYFQLAVERDANYARGYAGLADSYNLLADYGALAPSEALPKALAAARKALELDDSLAEAHASLGWTSMVYEWDWTTAEREFQRALQLDPGYAPAHQWRAYLLRVSGRPAEALAEAQRAAELEPSSLIIHSIVGWHHYLSRQYEPALQQFRKTQEMDPNFARVHSYLGWTYLQQQKYDQAIAELEKARELSGGSPARLAELGHAYALAGRREKALKLLAELTALARHRYVEPDLMALIYAGL